jgi:hypothetical protein
MPSRDKPAKTGKMDKAATKKPSAEIAISDHELDKASGGGPKGTCMNMSAAVDTKGATPTERDR